MLHRPEGRATEEWMLVSRSHSTQEPMEKLCSGRCRVSCRLEKCRGDFIKTNHGELPEHHRPAKLVSGGSWGGKITGLAGFCYFILFL